MGGRKDLASKRQLSMIEETDYIDEGEGLYPDQNENEVHNDENPTKSRNLFQRRLSLNGIGHSIAMTTIEENGSIPNSPVTSDNNTVTSSFDFTNKISSNNEEVGYTFDNDSSVRTMAFSREDNNNIIFSNESSRLKSLNFIAEEYLTNEQKTSMNENNNSVREGTISPDNCKLVISNNIPYYPSIKEVDNNQNTTANIHEMFQVLIKSIEGTGAENNRDHYWYKGMEVEDTSQLSPLLYQTEKRIEKQPEAVNNIISAFKEKFSMPNAKRITVRQKSRRNLELERTASQEKRDALPNDKEVEMMRDSSFEENEKTTNFEKEANDDKIDDTNSSDGTKNGRSTCLDEETGIEKNVPFSSIELSGTNDETPSGQLDSLNENQKTIIKEETVAIDDTTESLLSSKTLIQIGSASENHEKEAKCLANDERIDCLKDGENKDDIFEHADGVVDEEYHVSVDNPRTEEAHVEQNDCAESSNAMKIESNFETQNGCELRGHECSESNVNIDTGFESNVNIDTGFESNVNIDTGFESNVNIDTGFESNVNIDTGFESNVNIDTGFESNVNIDTGFESNVNIDTGFESNVNIDTGFESNVNIDTGFESNVNIDTGFESNVNIDTGFESNVNIDTGFESNVNIDNEFEKDQYEIDPKEKSFCPIIPVIQRQGPKYYEIDENDDDNDRNVNDSDKSLLTVGANERNSFLEVQENLRDEKPTHLLCVSQDSNPSLPSKPTSLFPPSSPTPDKLCPNRQNPTQLPQTSTQAKSFLAVPQNESCSNKFNTNFLNANGSIAKPPMLRHVSQPNMNAHILPKIHTKPPNTNNQSGNPSPRESKFQTEDLNSDLAKLKATAIRLNLSTRRPSYLKWLEDRKSNWPPLGCMPLGGTTTNTIEKPQAVVKPFNLTDSTGADKIKDDIISSCDVSPSNSTCNTDIINESKNNDNNDEEHNSKISNTKFTLSNKTVMDENDLPLDTSDPGDDDNGDGGAEDTQIPQVLAPWVKYDKRDRLTPDRKERIDKSLEWLQTELKSMRNQDQQLARQLLAIRQEIHKLKLSLSYQEHRDHLEDVQCDLEDLQEFANVLDLPSTLYLDTPLKNVGVTKWNITARRFSTC